MLIIEGKKMVLEAIKSGWQLEAVMIAEGSLMESDLLLHELLNRDCSLASSEDFNRLSSLQTPEGILAVVHFPQPHFAQPQDIATLPPGHGLLLEKIQDPGNLGTLIRTADWFGIRQIYCSVGTVDLLNPKTLRSSMGSIFRVNVAYISNWEALLKTSKARIWLADMQGTPAHEAQFAAEDWVLLGNEANGISPNTRSISDFKKTTLPGTPGAESLNAAVAGGILSYLFE